ncbi:MAG TPA: cytochrome c3 family protein, partial [Armatimonadota bacterium]|nr:cytochrome c3 family protein [Armatimonadota bacterium]
MRKAAWFLYVVSLALAAGLTAFSSRLSPALAQDDADIIAPADMETCLGCHGDAADMAKLASSAHGNVTCQACHRGVDRFPHPEQAVANKAACASCHARIGAQMAGSVHRAGAAKGKAPTCRSCHPGSAHAITRARAQSPAAQDAACAACHAGEAAAVKRSIHGQPGISGGPRAGCRACHERNPHAIRPPGARAKEESCRACHDDVHTALAGSVHKGAALACAACHTGSMHAVRRAPAPSAKTDAACRACHRESLTAMAGTAHAGQSCRACHDADAHRIQPPPRDAAAASARCAACHAGVAQAMTTSVHGRAVAVGKPNAPQCVTCHGEKAHGVAKAAALAAQPRDAACRACHADAARALRDSVHRDAFTENGTPASCFACHGAGPHAVQTINAGTAAQLVALCQRCHADKVAMPGTSKHDLPDIVAGDHPTCLTCHTDSVHGASAHGITKPPAPTPRDQVVLCSRCHDDAALMGRYGMTTDSVSSYRQSFHGRAVVNFKMAGSATCTDCHGLHAVMAPDAADSPVNPANVAATCGQCHPGAKMNFAMSGANHLRLKIAQNPILRIEEMAFMWLIYGAMSFLFIMVLLDLRRKLFDPDCLPACGKPITLLISPGCSRWSAALSSP